MDVVLYSVWGFELGVGCSFWRLPQTLVQGKHRGYRNERLLRHNRNSLRQSLDEGAGRE